jgi:hypothetical protein
MELAVDQTVCANLGATVRGSLCALAANASDSHKGAVSVDLGEQRSQHADDAGCLDAEQRVLNAKLSVVEAERNVNADLQLLTTLGVFDVRRYQLAG